MMTSVAFDRNCFEAGGVRAHGLMLVRQLALSRQVLAQKTGVSPAGVSPAGVGTAKQVLTQVLELKSRALLAKT